jgi:cellulose synthase (UDP-forming)
MIWTLYNMTILGGALAGLRVAAGPCQSGGDGDAGGHQAGERSPLPLYRQGLLQRGVGVLLEAPAPGRQGEGLVAAAVTSGSRRSPPRCSRCSAASWDWSWNPWRRQHVEFIQCTFARADTWSLWQQRRGQGSPPPQPDRHYPARLGAYWRLACLTHRLCLYPPREAGSLAPLLRSPSRLPRFPGRDSDLTDSEG